ncbi:MAG: hypothetical protein LH654_07885 [Thermoleophilia bacterium]|nr:hypothetical protein [Thermoleophilia bacterium]
MPQVLPADHPTAVAFLDETGAIASDRIFAVGCLKVVEPADLLRPVQKLRDRRHQCDEIHWVDATRESVPFYKEVIDIVRGAPGVRFSCFVADRQTADPDQPLRQPVGRLRAARGSAADRQHTAYRRSSPGSIVKAST